MGALRREFHLDAPLVERYARWMWRLAHLDLGRSIASGRPVAVELVRAMPFTLSLASLALLLTIGISAGAAAVGTYWHAPRIARALRLLTIFTASIPVYWIALVTITVGLVWLQTPDLLDADSPVNLATASLLLALGPGLSIGRVLQQRVLGEQVEDYVRLAASIGLSRWRILREDIARAVAPSALTLWANSFGYLLGGSIAVERIFDRPGLGNLALQAVQARDYPVLQAYLLLAAVIFVVVNIFADLLAAWADPRMRGGVD
jgi:ABC-type dipeptide/oligopeptide/nickel transport system permease component